MHVAIAGNIGAGKTTLARRLAEHYGWEACFESVDDNPYLADFYADMPRWAFHLQVYFLNSRFNQVLRVQKNPHHTIQDRTIYEDAFVFAQNLQESGIMSARDYSNYRQVFDNMTKYISAPDLLIYLRADLPVLRKRIQLRGRSYEVSIPDEYLLNLNTHYENWIEGYQEGNLLIININERDLLENSSDWQHLLDGIESYLTIKN
ncbi:MAG: deoxynucleoside kinase [Microscillaceae bacterium]|jgi:deoxyadenosine/deoxycytidine kinase|nr:deoxynucleoside kinase [Microscillaceae bacterium]